MAMAFATIPRLRLFRVISEYPPTPKGENKSHVVQGRQHKIAAKTRSPHKRGSLRNALKRKCANCNAVLYNSPHHDPEATCVARPP